MTEDCTTKATLVEEMVWFADLTKKRPEIIVDTMFRSIVEALHQAKRSTTPGSSPCATCAPAQAASSLRPTSEPTSTKETGKRSEHAPPVIRNIRKRGIEADPLRGLFGATVDVRSAVVEYELDTDLRDTVQIPLQEEGGVEAFLWREALPFAADACYQAETAKIEPAEIGG